MRGNYTHTTVVVFVNIYVQLFRVFREILLFTVQHKCKITLSLTKSFWAGTKNTCIFLTELKRNTYKFKYLI